MNLTHLLVTQLLKGSGTPEVVETPKPGSVLSMRRKPSKRRGKRSRSR